MKKGSVGHAFLFLALALLLSSPFVFAGIGDWFNSITGKATSDSTDLYVRIGNTGPTVTFIEDGVIDSVTPIAALTRHVFFEFNATDADGVANLNDTAAQGNLTFEAVTYSNNSCSHIIDYAALDMASYNCSFNIDYFARNGTWVANASITDINLAYDSLVNETMTVNIVHDTNFSDADGGALNLSFPSISPTDTNTGSTNDPVRIFNRGNYEGLIFNVTAYDLGGWVTKSEQIGANNFSVDTTNPGCGGTQLANTTDVSISGFTLTRGAGAQEEMFFCIDSVLSTLSSQPYNTTEAYALWTVETSNVI